jgi:ATP-dependent Zn protease
LYVIGNDVKNQVVSAKDSDDRIINAAGVLINECADLLATNKDLLKAMAKELLNKKSLSKSEMTGIMGLHGFDMLEENPTDSNIPYFKLLEDF